MKMENNLKSLKCILNGSKRCNLCLMGKLLIIMGIQQNCLIKDLNVDRKMI